MAVAERLVVVGGIEAVQANLDALAHHPLKDRQPLWIAHAAAIGAIGTARYGAPFERSIGIALQAFFSGSARRRAQQIVGPHARPLLAEQAESLLVIPKVHGCRQLAGDECAGFLYLRNDLGGQVQVGLRTAQGHARPRRLDILITDERVEIDSEVPHLHQLDPSSAHVINDLRRGWQGPMFDDAAYAVLCTHLCLS